MSFIDDLEFAKSQRNPVLYYDFLAESGDTYGKLAKGVVTADTYSGYIARGFAGYVAVEEGGSISSQEWYKLSLELMDRDFDARTMSEDGALGWDTIKDYHENVFAQFGLPIYAWTAYTPLQLVNDKASLWETMLDSDGYQAIYSSAAVVTMTGLASAFDGSQMLAEAALDALFGGEDQSLDAYEQFAAENNIGQSWAEWLWIGAKAMDDYLVARPLGDPAPADVQAFHFTQDGIEFIGGADLSDDVLQGTNGNDNINGYKGDDVIYSGPGSDWVYGGGGNDVIYSGAGDDFLDGDFGFDSNDGSYDVFVADGVQNGVILDFGAADEVDRLKGVVVAIEDGFGDSDYLSGFEELALSVYSDTVFLSDDNMALDFGVGVFSGLGHDTLDASGFEYGLSMQTGVVHVFNSAFEGFETILGSEASDELTFGGSIEVLHGGAGDDFLTGFVSNSLRESFLVGGLGDDCVRAGIGIDVMYGSDIDFDQNDNPIPLVPASGERNTLSFELSDYGVSVVLSDNLAVSATLSGGFASGDSAFGFTNISGSSFDDELFGNSEDNFIFGSGGNDEIRGMGGNDVIAAGAGVNTLFGGDGDDLFFFEGESLYQSSHVGDFVLLEDHFDFSDLFIQDLSFENSWLDEDSGKMCVGEGWGRVDFDDGFVTFDIVGVKQGFEGLDIYVDSIFV